MPEENDNDNEWDGDASSSENQTELAEAEVIDAEEVDHNPALSKDVEALATFSEEEGPLSFRIMPAIEGGQTDWRLNVYSSGVQGPIYQSRDGLTAQAVEQFGISSILQSRVNDALHYAKKNLEVPDGLGDQKREKRSLHELEVMMEES
ncbi:hypothetical protein [Halanaeroarchaeum sp. HSR-CO]|uniref:hypothetical protein n=1 Tax=Halanaeroarchaeum sp. HSR-CO TaxID=2866382 RepID=UPI00217D1C20|nr:hypothetical protein [Halanaeroarchaeum sp. HSR-CO]